MGRAASQPTVLLVADEALISGAELAQRVRQMRPDLPIVYASGRYGSCDFSSAVPRSVFVPNPYDPDDVCALLERVTAA